MTDLSTFGVSLSGFGATEVSRGKKLAVTPARRCAFQYRIHCVGGVQVCPNSPVVWIDHDAGAGARTPHAITSQHDEHGRVNVTS